MSFDVIKLLPDSVANQIAAGEVIQRPASVVKELMENALDAGATQIDLVVKDAGRTLISVIDNGHGMSETDARLCFERHATSKIKKAEDLFLIRTMGFRGEALASIAAVAQVELTTRRKEDELGTKIFIEAITIHAVVWLGGGAFGWRTIAIIYAVLGLIVNTISVFSVKELPEADEGMEEERAEESKLTFAKSLKLLLKNKYYVIICISYIFTQIYASVIGIGTYYAKYILGNEGLFSDLSLAINITMVVALTVLPIVIQKMGGMYKLNVLGYLVAALGRVGVLVAAYMGSFPLMLAFTAVSTLGIAPLQGDLNALIASCSEYTTLTTGYRLDGMMYSCSSLGIKIGGAFGTAICGWILDAAGYVENAAVQTTATINTLHFLYLWAPIIICVAVMFLLTRLKVEKANAQLLKTQNMTDDDVPTVYGNV